MVIAEGSMNHIEESTSFRSGDIPVHTAQNVQNIQNSKENKKYKIL
jgi:hypothetical protein